MNASRALRYLGFTSLCLLGLFNIVACDYSSSVERNSNPADEASQYTGALHPATLTRDNATRLVARALGAKRAAITGGEARSGSNSRQDESSEYTGLAQVLSQLNEKVRISVLPTLVGVAVQGKSRARVQTNRTIDCDIGSIRVTRRLEDDDSGSIKLEFLYCNLGNTIFDGELSLLIRKIDRQNNIITDYNYRFKELLWSAPDLNLRLDGAMDVFLDINSKTEQLTIKRFLTINDINNEMAMLANTVNFQQLQSLVEPSPSLETQYGRLFDSVHGYIDFTTTVPLLYTPSVSRFPVSGQALVRGGSSAVRVTIMPFQRVKLELDQDGDSSFEILTIVDWAGIVNGIELIDSDGDGIHDRWEIFYGLNPLDDADATQDADNDGFSNLEEYLGGSNPNLAISTPG